MLAPAVRGGEVEQWDEIKAAVSEALIDAGGTITHHHAVGRDHRPWYDRQRPAPFAAALRAAKAELDPAGILNPGVLIDPPDLGRRYPFATGSRGGRLRARAPSGWKRSPPNSRPCRPSPGRPSRRRAGRAAPLAAARRDQDRAAARSGSKTSSSSPGCSSRASSTSPTTCSRRSITFVAFCLISSAGYFVNDLLDVELDRKHPKKRFRPLAAGELSERTAMTIAPVLAAVAIALAFAAVNWQVGLMVVGYGVAQMAYSLGLKQIVIVDVMTLAGLFILRVAAGASAVDAHASEWLILCTGMLAAFLGFTKRRQEAVSELHQGTTTRPVLEHYSLPFLDQMVSLVTTGTVISYAIYTVNSPLIGSQMMLTIPPVVYGIFRYLYLIYDRSDDRSISGSSPATGIRAPRPRDRLPAALRLQLGRLALRLGGGQVEAGAADLLAVAWTTAAWGPGREWRWRDRHHQRCSWPGACRAAAGLEVGGGPRRARPRRGLDVTAAVGCWSRPSDVDAEAMWKPNRRQLGQRRRSSRRRPGRACR